MSGAVPDGVMSGGFAVLLAMSSPMAPASCALRAFSTKVQPASADGPPRSRIAIFPSSGASLPSIVQPYPVEPEASGPETPASVIGTLNCAMDTLA